MATIDVYPRRGTTYPDAAGVTIATAGATVDASKYIADALRRGLLLTEDPYGIFLPEDRTGGGSSGLASRSFQTFAALTAAVGLADGEAVELLGYHSAGDGGGGTFYWALGDATAANGGTIAGAGSGRWKRIYSGSVDIRWFGARGDAATNDSPALASALSAADRVSIPEGSFRLATQVVVGSGKSIIGSGPDCILLADVVRTGAAALGNQTGCALLFQNAYRTLVRDLSIHCNSADTSAVGLRATSAGECMYNDFEDVYVLLAASGETAGYDIYVTEVSSGNCVYFPRFVGGEVKGQVAGLNDTSWGIRMRGPSTSQSRSVGGRIVNTRFWCMHTGVDLDNCDTWNLIGPAFDSIYQDGAPISTAKTGRALKIGSYTAQHSLQGGRFEDNDVYVEVAGLAHRIDLVQGPASGKIINTSDADVFVSGSGAFIPSQVQQTMRFGRAIQVSNHLGVTYYEPTTVAGGSTITSLVDDSGVVAPTVRLAGAGSAFSLGGIRVPTMAFNQAGAMKFVYNTTAQQCTVLHEHAGATAAERIHTLTGANVVVNGPAVMRFMYDLSVNGSYGAGRWIYMGAA